jgi:hypothetical protein
MTIFLYIFNENLWTKGLNCGKMLLLKVGPQTLIAEGSEIKIPLRRSR